MDNDITKNNKPQITVKKVTDRTTGAVTYPKPQVKIEKVTDRTTGAVTYQKPQVKIEKVTDRTTGVVTYQKPQVKIEKVTKNPPGEVTCQKPEEPKEKTRITITKTSRNKEADEKLQEVEESLTRDYQKITQVIIEEINKYATTDEQKLRALVAWFQKNVCYWDNYPRSIADGIRTTTYTTIIDGIKIDYPYRSKESVIVNGFGICECLSKAFQDIAKRMGIKVYTISNTYHVWLVWRSEKGQLHLDLSQAIPHLKTQSPENKNATREVIPIDPELAEVSILKTLEEIKRFKSPKSYSHDNGKIEEEPPNVGNNF